MSGEVASLFWRSDLTLARTAFTRHPGLEPKRFDMQLVRQRTVAMRAYEADCASMKKIVPLIECVNMMQIAPL